MDKECAELVERGSPLRELNFQKSHSTVCKSSPPCQSFFFVLPRLIKSPYKIKFCKNCEFLQDDILFMALLTLRRKECILFKPGAAMPGVTGSQ